MDKTQAAATQKTVIVTGASSGIGRAAALALAADGWQVIATARRADKLAELTGNPNIVSYPLDLTDADAVSAAITELTGQYTISALVNNAGGAFGLEPVADTDFTLWQRMFELNVIATFRLTQGLLPTLIANRGDILTITSVAGIEPYPLGAGYVAAKHAESAANRSLRLELVSQPVRVMEISPGMVYTDEFSLTRFDGDAERAAAVYTGVDPLVAEDIAEAIRWCLAQPSHVNIDQLTIRPRQQAAAHLVHREAD